MIPHYSNATLMSEREDISDPCVKGHSESIIQAQQEEIAQMKKRVEDLEEE